MSDATRGASKGWIVSELTSRGLCPEETGEPRRALSKVGEVPWLHMERPFWLLCAGSETGKQGTEEGTRWPQGEGREERTDSKDI